MCSLYVFLGSCCIHCLHSEEVTYVFLFRNSEHDLSAMGRKRPSEEHHHITGTEARAASSYIKAFGRKASQATQAEVLHTTSTQCKTIGAV